MGSAAKCQAIEPEHPRISISRQCELLSLARSSYYYEPCPESADNLRYMRLIDEQYLRTPFYGSPRMTEYLRRQGYSVNEKRVARLMRLMGIQGIQPRKNQGRQLPGEGHQIYPYLLRDVVIERPNHVWSTDITYVPLQGGFLYLMAVIDWYSRFVLSWELSNSMERSFCIAGTVRALEQYTRPEIFNTDQGSQFTSQEFTGLLKKWQVAISMDGRGRALDNVFIERLWRSVKYEYIYLHEHTDGKKLYQGLARYFQFYNFERPHQSLGYQTPAEIYLNFSHVAGG